MFENEKLCIVMNIVQVFNKHESPPIVLSLENKKIIIFIDLVICTIVTLTRRVAKQMLLTFMPKTKSMFSKYQLK